MLKKRKFTTGLFSYVTGTMQEQGLELAEQVETLSNSNALSLSHIKKLETSLFDSRTRVTLLKQSLQEKEKEQSLQKKSFRDHVSNMTKKHAQEVALQQKSHSEHNEALLKEKAALLGRIDALEQKSKEQHDVISRLTVEKNELGHISAKNHQEAQKYKEQSAEHEKRASESVSQAKKLLGSVTALIVKHTTNDNVQWLSQVHQQATNAITDMIIQLNQLDAVQSIAQTNKLLLEKMKSEILNLKHDNERLNRENETFKSVYRAQASAVHLANSEELRIVNITH